MFKDNGLSIVVFGLFLAAFIHRARDGRHARLQRRAGPTWRDARVLDRVRTLLGPGAIVLSIFLRQRGSAESKPVDAAHCETGKD